jgi:hypothetical protein
MILIGRCGKSAGACAAVCAALCAAQPIAAKAKPRRRRLIKLDAGSMKVIYEHNGIALEA